MPPSVAIRDGKPIPSATFGGWLVARRPEDSAGFIPAVFGAILWGKHSTVKQVLNHQGGTMGRGKSEDDSEAEDEREIFLSAMAEAINPIDDDNNPQEGNKAWSSPIGPVPKGLTHKQEKFCQLVADGKNQSEAYRIAFQAKPTTQANSIWAKSSYLASLPKVKDRINHLRMVKANESWHDMGKMRALALKTLEQEALGLGPDTKSSSRTAAAVAIGKITEVNLFTDHKVIEHRDDARIAELKDKLSQRLTALFGKAQSSPVTALLGQSGPETDNDGGEAPTPPGTPVQ